jgi:hypothetical protein
MPTEESGNSSDVLPADPKVKSLGREEEQRASRRGSTCAGARLSRSEGMPPACRRQFCLEVLSGIA